MKERIKMLRTSQRKIQYDQEKRKSRYRRERSEQGEEEAGNSRGKRFTEVEEEGEAVKGGDQGKNERKQK